MTDHQWRETPESKYRPHCGRCGWELDKLTDKLDRAYIVRVHRENYCKAVATLAHGW